MAPEPCVKDLRLVLDEGQCVSVPSPPTYDTIIRELMTLPEETKVTNPSPPTYDTIIREGAWQKDQLT
jgi:hypothetical protein